MEETSLSLLAQLRHDPSTDGWARLQRLYEPLVHNWLKRYGLQRSDADDVTQEVLIAISDNIRTFEHNGRTGAFRAWVRGILVNRLRRFWRSRSNRTVATGDTNIELRLAELEDPASEISLVWNREHDQHVLRELLAIVEPLFEPTTWMAFLKVTFDGVKAGDVATELGISRNAVFIAKSRVLSRLRQEADGLVDSKVDFPSPR